jgi:hypothetical protein
MARPLGHAAQIAVGADIAEPGRADGLFAAARLMRAPLYCPIVATGRVFGFSQKIDAAAEAKSKINLMFSLRLPLRLCVSAVAFLPFLQN